MEAGGEIDRGEGRCWKKGKQQNRWIKSKEATVRTVRRKKEAFHDGLFRKSSKDVRGFWDFVERLCLEGVRWEEEGRRLGRGMTREDRK
jgi:hypothetical protein